MNLCLKKYWKVDVLDSLSALGRRGEWGGIVKFPQWTELEEKYDVSRVEADEKCKAAQAAASDSLYVLC